MRKPFKAALATLFLSVLAGASNADAGPLDSPGAHKAGLQRLPRLRRQSAQQDRSDARRHGSGIFQADITSYAEGKRRSPEMEPYAKYVLELVCTKSPPISPPRRKQRPPSPRSRRNDEPCR